MGSFLDACGGLEGYAGQIKRLHEDPSPYVWPKQFARILTPYFSADTVLVDVGCSVGYAYKDFRKFDLAYVGLDLEEELLKIARGYFADDPKATFIQYDLMRGPLPLSGDIVILSDMLGYCSDLITPLTHLADATKDILLLRALLGETEIRYTREFLTPEGEPSSLPSNQFAYNDVAHFLYRGGFEVEIIEDEYTGSKPFVRRDRVRRLYIIFARRKSQ